MNIQKIKNQTNFNEILSTIQNSKQKVLQQVNSTFIELYQNIGKHISTKTIKENWGKSVVKELANYIKQQDHLKRDFYIQMCKIENWSVSTFRQRIDSMLYERTAISKKPDETILADLKELDNNNSEIYINSNLESKNIISTKFL